MRNLTLRLIFISGFLLLNIASLYSQCPDTQPVVIGPDVVRAGQTVTYMTYAIPGHNYSWSLSGSGTITGSATTNQITVAWGNTPASATLTVSETNSAVPGCTAKQAQKTITLQPLLHAYYYYQFDPTGGCYYNIVNFSSDPNISVHPNDPSITYTWNFGDGTGYVPGAAGQTHTFPVTGIYTTPHTFPVTLVIQNPAGQKDSITDYVYVDPDKFKPTANISSVTPPVPNCLYNQYTFSASGSLPKPPSNPDPNIKIKYCDWYVNGVLFYHAGDGQPPYNCPLTANYTFTAAGTYTITLTITNTINCTNTTTAPVTVGNTVPLAAFSNTQACVNENTVFTDQSLPNIGTITDWWWSWGDGSGTQHFNIPANPPPATVTHMYTDLLPHNVTLKVMNLGGCENTSPQIQVQASPSPKADFAFPVVICEGDVVTFSDMSSPLTGSPIASYLWNFDDPTSPSNTSADPNPQHLFSGPGSFHVTLTVTNQNGCANTKTLTTNPVVVNPHPDINFTYVPGSGVNEFIFTAQTNPAQNVGNNVHWEFGDGTNGFGSPITHTYPGPGNYTVRCTATDMASGCSSVIEQNLMLGGTPVACFTANPPNQCQNVPILFVPCTPPGGLISYEIWDFGDGSPPVRFDFPNVPASPSHSFTLPGTFQVVRDVYVGTTLVASFSLWVTIYDAPTANFIWFSDPAHLHQGQACDGQNVYFQDESFSNATPPGSIYQWAWNFDDPASGPNNTSALQNPNHVFLGNKTSYNVTLQAWDNLQNCPSQVKQISVTINEPIQVEFSYSNDVCVDQTANFSWTPYGTPPHPTSDFTWLWNFGDGNTSIAPGTVSHLYNSVGNYVVTLTLTDVNGCSKSKQHTVSIIPKPVANFSFTSPSCFGTGIQFTDLSFVPLPYNDVIVTWDWNFGDGSPHSPFQNPSHTYLVYSATGYPVTLSVTTNRGCTETKTITVTQIAAPLADFQVTPGTFSCITPQAVQFTDLSQTSGGGNILYWHWDFGDPASGSSNLSTAQNPSHVYNTPGNKMVTLRVTNSNYCETTISKPITVNGLPAPDFSYTPTCLTSMTAFTDLTVPNASGILSWTWDFGDGGSAGTQNPVYSFTTAGIHPVKLTVQNSNGCIDFITKNVIVSPQAIVDFITSSPFCQFEEVTFTSQAYVPAGFTSYINSWSWDFGDGSFGSGPVVLHTFTDPSFSHTVTLTVTTTDNCMSSIQKIVTGTPSPIADFTPTGPSCLDQAMTFINNSQPNGGGTITQWSWNFDDPASGSSNLSNLQSPTHVFKSTGVHHVTLIVTNVNQCASLVKTIDVTTGLKPVAAFSSSNTCLGTMASFTDNSTTDPGSTIVTWAWNFGDGGTSPAQNPTYMFNTAGIHYVVLTVTNSNGCIQTVTNPIEIYPQPVTSFTFSSPTCAGGSVTFTDVSNTGHGYITDRSWNFGDGGTQTTTSPTVTHTYTNGGPYQVSLTVTTSDNCTGTQTLPVSIQFAPVAAFTVSSSLCIQAPVQFTDNSQLNGGSQVTQWTWDFGDPGSGGNNISHQPSPVHNFSSAGLHTVSLTVTNADGCDNSITHDVTINDNPTADFSFTSVCKNSPTVFTDNSSGGTLATWAWTFGDGGSSPVQNPSWTYANPGTYTVVLVVTTIDGCHASKSKQVVVYEAPVAQFSFSSPTCANDSVQFTTLSTTAHGSINNWTWDFGDGTVVSIPFGTNPNLKHKYLNGGPYNVMLTITTTDNCTASTTSTVNIEFKPVCDWSNSSGACASTPNQFTDLSQANGGTPVVAWLWDFGDPASGANNTSPLKNPTHSFSSGTQFWVKLKVTNATGCYDTLRKQITVNAAPVADFSSDTACISSPTQFNDGSTSSSGTVNAWQWDFGDPSSGSNNVSTLQNPTHNYAAPGNYMVRLRVTNTNNCSKDTLKQVTVNPKPQALFQYTAACALDSTAFTDLSIAPLSQIVAWSWDFGDGGTSTIQNPKHKYSAAGTFLVKEVVTNLSGCKDSVSVSVIVHPKPAAAFQYTSKFCPKGQVTFQDMSQASGASITDHLWTFEAGATSTVPNPVYSFPVTDTIYPVSLIVTDTYGCKDTVIDSVHVKPAFKFTFTNDTVCFGYPSHFHPVNLAQGDSLYSPKWEFGDPNSGPANTSSNYNSAHNFTAPGLYYVKLKVFNTDNCSDSVFKTVQVYALPKPAFSYIAPQCDSVLHFHDTTSNYGNTGVSSWTWNFGDGTPPLVIPAPGPGDTSHIYSTPGDYVVTMIITNAHGCVDSVTKGVTRLPCIKASYTYTDTLRCANYMITFRDTSVPVSRIRQWTWAWDDGTADTVYSAFTPTVKHMFAIAGTYNVKLKIKAIVNSVNVFDSVIQSVLIHPTPSTLFSDIPVCLHQPAVFKDTSLTFGESVTAWKWNFGEPSSGVRDTSSLKNPTHIYATRDTFNVKLVNMNRFGCKDSLIKSIRIYGLPQASFKYTAACTGDPTLFRDSSFVADTTIGSWHWNFGDPSSTRDTSILRDPSFKYKTVGNYIVRLIVRDKFGCRDTVDSTVAVHVTPVSAFTLINGYDGTQGKVKLNNFSTGASAYNWDFGNGKTSNDTNPVASYTEDGTYTIMLISTNTFGCTDTTYYEYKILFRGLFVPNAFAPTSGNMAVRLFKPVGINLKTYNISVFDNWGHLLWESNKLDNNGAPLEGWDGTYNGNMMPQGNYFWKATATFVDDSPWTGSDTGVNGGGGTMGSVILVR